VTKQESKLIKFRVSPAAVGLGSARGPVWRLLALMLLPACALAPAARAQHGVFKNEELDQMLAPVALYPDALLAQLLMASTYPADFQAALKWSKAHPDDKVDAAVAKVEAQDRDPSVKSLVAFPRCWR
jgi:hypothetical protein